MRLEEFLQRGQAAQAAVDKILTPSLRLFVPGPLVSTMNAREHWSKHARYKRDWRERTAQVALIDRLQRAKARDAALALYQAPQAPKTIHLTAHTVRRWDQDNLAAGLKPVLDGLMDSKIIHDDGPDSGHTVTYAQILDPQHRGVEILVEAAP